MGASRNEPNSELDFATLPGILKRNAKGLILAAVGVGAITYAGLTLVPSRYTSTAQISISAKTRDGSGGTDIAALQVDREAIRSRVQELRSPDLARRLASELQLNRRPEFNSAIESPGVLGLLKRLTGLGQPRAGETEEERVLAAYDKALQVYEMKETRVIAISFTAGDGVLAAKAANRLIELYQARLRQQGASVTTDANAWLAPEIEKRTKELAQAEAAVERFRSTANLFRGSGSGTQPGGLAEQQLTDLNSELTKMRGQRSEADARARAARELMARGAPDAIPDVQKSPVIQGLIAQRVRAERELAEASTQLLPAHPRMKQLIANVADIRRQVQREAGTIVEGLEREAKVLQLREELAQRSLDEAKARVGDKADDRVKLAQLEDEVLAKRRELTSLRERFEAARSRGTTKPIPVEVQVIATALPSSKPSWPNRIQMSGLAAAATLVLGLVLVLFRALLGGSAPASQGRRRSEPHLGVDDDAAGESPAVAMRPRVAPAAAQAAAQAARAAPPRAGVTRLASADDVVARLLATSSAESGYRTVIVGGDDDTDAREVVLQVSAGLVSQGRQVVVVDWSLDGAGIAKALGLAPIPGFTDLLAGTHVFEDAIKVLPESGVHVLPCGSATHSPEQVLDGDRLNMMLDALDEAYQDVIVTGRHSAVRELFLAIEGRVDAGVLIGAEEAARDGGRSVAGTRFLGFDVTEIDVMQVGRDGGVAAMRGGVRARAARRGGTLTAPAGA